MPSTPIAFVIITVSAAVSLVSSIKCPRIPAYAVKPEKDCNHPSDPNNLSKSNLESWFTQEMFNDIFQKANLGRGPHPCLPYSYESFIIAARYFPEFGAESPKNDYTATQNVRRDVAAFFAHVIQETGENNPEIYSMNYTVEGASNCFYRGGLYNWNEGGRKSKFLTTTAKLQSPKVGEQCTEEGRYCASSRELDFWYPCNRKLKVSGNITRYEGCYFGRGPLQLSWSYNYGQFEHFLRIRKINVDLLEHPNLLLTTRNPPLAMIASLWFYMTPQPPKPSMHDIVLGQWKSSPRNRRAGFHGAIFGPTSLIINKECGGESEEEPGGPGENRRIKAFKWFCKYFNVPAGPERTLSCKGLLEGFEATPHMYSWQPNWSTMWKSQPCDCAPANHSGAIPYYDTKYYPPRYTKLNDRNRLRCVYSLYKNPALYQMTKQNSNCLNFPVRIKITKDGA